MTLKLAPPLAALALLAAAPVAAQAPAPLPNAPLAVAPPARLPATPIDPARLTAHVQVLASDAYQGRGIGTAGEIRTIRYIASRLAAEGVEPGAPDGSWFQAVPLIRFELKGPVRLALTAGESTDFLTQGQQAVVQTLAPVDRVAIKDAPLVFVGYGVTAPQCGWDDFKGLDLTGKVALVLVNDPDFEAPKLNRGPGCFGGRAMTYYGRWTYKYEEAARRGAVGVLIVHETEPAGYGWATVRNSNVAPQFDIARTGGQRAHPLLQGWIQRDVAVDLFRRSGLDFEAIKRAAESPAFHPIALKGASFSADYAVSRTEAVTHNVIGRLPGTLHPDEVVIYSAHWDHFGIGAPDAKGDSIYNGAVDNATGVAALLELARVFAAAPRTQRSVVFLATTAEEKNLLGALYYTLHPVYPLATTAADINMDMIYPDGPARDISTYGAGKVELENLLAADAALEGRAFSPDAEPEKGYFYRADHFAFARAGVPAITLSSGEDLYVGGRAAGAAYRQDYVANRYHQPGDEWNAGWNLEGAAIDLGLLYKLGRGLADSRQWPGWNPGSEFKALRERTAAARP